MRRVLFYTVSLTCALAINIALVSLLIFAAPKNRSDLPYEKLPSKFTLSQTDHTVTPIEKIEQTATISLPEKPQQTALTAQTISYPSFNEQNIELNDFFSRGQEILASLEEKAPIPNARKKTKNLIDHFANTKNHSYCSKTLAHISSHYASLKKRNAKSLAQWYEHPTAKPDVTVHVLKNGSLKSIFLKKTSGSSMHDKLYVQAIKQAAPFPKIPDHFGTNELIFEL